MTSNLCEALVCGTTEQSIFQQEIPSSFHMFYFRDIFRACVARQVCVSTDLCFYSLSPQVLPLGLYRAPLRSEGAYMPFVYTCPPPTTILNMGDKLYVYGSPKNIKAVFQQLSLPFTKQGGTTILGWAECFCCCCFTYKSFTLS